MKSTSFFCVSNVALSCLFGCLFCTPLQVFSSDEPGGKGEVTFLKVPLICDAAPQIGCGSRAKFIMIDLMNDVSVREAWLNRQGTVMAVIWKAEADENRRQEAIKVVFAAHGLPATKLTGTDGAGLYESFASREGWYLGSAVDALSIEEAGVIADQVVASVEGKAAFKSADDKKAFREDVRNIVKDCFLSIRSYKELDDALYTRVERDIIAAGERYVGKGNMPAILVHEEECEHESDFAGCCSEKK